LYKSSKHYLFASGAKNADWLVIGYSPEMYSGIGYEPFAADAGELLVNMLKAVGIDNPRKQAYLINVFDINRSNDEQINDLESINLRNQLISKVTSINPKMILLVGQLAAQNLLEIDDPLVIMRSKLHQLGENKIPCVVTYYPTYLVQKPIDKRKAWDDLKMAMSALNNVS